MDSPRPENCKKARPSRVWEYSVSRMDRSACRRSGPLSTTDPVSIMRQIRTSVAVGLDTASY